MEPGEKCICQENNWVNAFGDSNTVLHRGMRLTVVGSKNLGGLSFYSFNETPEDHYFLSHGFKPMRSLN